MPERLDNADLAKFIEDYVDSFVKWDIISFFCFNPSTSATAEDIARYVGRKEKEVERALEDLLKKGLFRKKPGDKPVYEYAPSEELKKMCLRFVQCLDERDTRLKVLAKLLKLQRRE